MPKVSRRRVKRRYERKERNIRAVFAVYSDGTEALTGYQVRVGGQERGVFPNITQARTARDADKAKAQRGPLVALGAGRLTWKEVADGWLKGPQVVQAKPRTRAGYEGIVNYRLKPWHDRPVNKITKADVKEFIAGLTADGLAPTTVGHVLFVLKCVMEDAVDNELIASNPCHGVKKPRGRSAPVQVPEIGQVEALLDALAGIDHPKAGEWALYAEVAAYAGLRAGELCGLRVQRLDVLRRRLTVVETVYVIGGRTSPGQPKSDAGHRTVDELPGDLCERLAAHVQRRAGDRYVFGNGVEPMRHDNYYRRVFKPTATAVGLPTLRFHDLRHYYASLLLSDQHLSVKDVATRLGHADASLVLRTYGHLFADAGAGLGDRVAERRAAARAAQGRVLPLARKA